MRKIHVAAALALAVSLCGAAYAQQPDGSIGEVFATDASVQGSVIFAGSGTRVGSGSTVSAGRTAASLRLDRGGEVRVCPGTSVSVTAAARSKGLLLSLDTGTIETHYSVGSSADTIQTPDFRIMLPGPGDFNFAISSDKKGNVCVRALESNSASIVVAEMMGDGTYQVRPNEQVTFSDGKVSNFVPYGRCGCAPPRENLKADAPKPSATYSTNTAVVPPPPIIAAAPEKPTEGQLAPDKENEPAPAPTPAISAAPPPSKPDDVHVQVEVPMVYSADPAPPAAPATVPTPVMRAPDPVYLPATVYFALFRPVMDVPVVTPAAPPPKPQKERKGFFGRLKSFFGGMFK